jgi:hypothetical protein
LYLETQPARKEPVIFDNIQIYSVTKSSFCVKRKGFWYIFISAKDVKHLLHCPSTHKAGILNLAPQLGHSDSVTGADRTPASP